MDTNELKALIRKHFREVSPGQGQYVHGSWFKPHSKDSLDDLLSEITQDLEGDTGSDDGSADVSSEIDRLKSIRDDIEAVIAELEEVGA